MKKLCSYLLMVFALILCLNLNASAKKAIKMSDKSIVVLPGETYKLSIKGKTKKVKWSTSNKKVAKVSKSGKVKAISKGKATIYATINGTTLKCKVEVPKTKKFEYKGHKYVIVNKGMKWSAAKKYCESLGGHLVTITSQDEQMQIVDQLKKMKKSKRNSYWLGAKQSDNGEIKWVTNEKFEYSVWATGQPDHQNEDCIMIYTIDNPNTFGDDSYLWNDLVNEGVFGTESWFGLKNFGFICEWDN